MRLNDARSRGKVARGARPTPMAEINIIPLVDVILVLLIIFMATTAFVRESGLKMQLPAAQTGSALAPSGHDLVVVLTRDNAMLVDGQNSNEKTLLARLQARAKANPQASITIKGDEGIPYARVVRVMDLARQAGLQGVDLGTRAPQNAGVAP